MDPASEGTVLFFDCPPQHVLIGPNTTTCMGNGEWEPTLYDTLIIIQTVIHIIDSDFGK